MKSVLFLVFVVHLGALCVNAQALSVNAQRFDFFYLVQQWPETYCNKNGRCCCPATAVPGDNFDVHGLWPACNNRCHPSCCDPYSRLNNSVINALKKELRKSWPSFDCRSSDGYSFWEHEWKNHGTCSESVINQRSYFNKTLALKREVNLLGALERKGIQPVNGKSYSLQDIIKAIEEGTEFTPVIECYEPQSGRKQLYRIYLCLNKSASNFINCCPPPGHIRCGNASTPIGFPSFRGWRDEEPDFPPEEMEFEDQISTLIYEVNEEHFERRIEV